MCGIAGVVYFDQEFPADVARRKLEAMCGCMLHRGPDSTGVFVSSPVALGLARLRIIDLSTKGDQPFLSEDGTIAAVCNGEIYNHAELRRELEAKGHRLWGGSDCEVLPHLYEEYGTELLARLRGMFALALWDGRKQRLILARDRLGQKPLYYHVSRRGIVFASEAKALFVHRWVESRLDPDGCVDFFRHRYTLGPQTAFHGIRKLSPGCFLSVNGRSVSEQRYWDLRERIREARARPLDSGEYAALLGESVRLRLMSDVPLGVYLSGGLDSSSIVALMRGLGVSQVKTFSIVFPNTAVDERRYSRMVAEHFATDHQEFECEARDFDVLGRVVYHLEEPLGDPAVIPTYLLSELASRHVTVVLTGEGSDEINGGYYKYLRMRRLELMWRLPRPLARAISHWTHGNPPLPVARSASSADDLHLFRELTFARRRIVVGLPVFSPDFRALLDGGTPDERYAAFIEESVGLDPVSRLAYQDVRTWLPDDLLLKVDKMSMAHSLEARSPFLDHHVVEAAMRMKGSQKVGFRQTKLMLRAAMRSRLPRAILTRRQHGLSLPLTTWLRGELNDYIWDNLDTAAFRQSGIVDPGGVQRMKDIYGRGRLAPDLTLFMLLMFSIWLQTFIATPPRIPIAAEA